MKKILLVLLPAILLISCEKQYLVPADEVPEWLKTRIAEIEDEIEANPKSGLDIGAWIRYEYNDQYYFEWHNLLSSSFPPIYDTDGNIMTYSWDNSSGYQKDKCCKKFVWKGPSWNDEYDGW